MVLYSDNDYIRFFCHLIFHYCFISFLQGTAAPMVHDVISAVLNLFPLQCKATTADQSNSAASQILAMAQVGSVPAALPFWSSGQYMHSMTPNYLVIF